MNTASSIRKHPETGLLYILQGAEAVIVGASAFDLTHLEIPAMIGDASAQYPVTGVGEAAFAYMTSLQSVSLPATIRHIAHGAFEGTGLTELTLPEGMQRAGACAFFGCRQLHRVSLPHSAAFLLEDQAFGECAALQRGVVDNAEGCAPEMLERAGLPVARAPVAAPPFTLPPEASATEQPLPESLLEQGVAHENAGRTADAAVLYMQAHALRASLGSVRDAQRQVTFLKAISEAEYRLALLLKFRLAPQKNPDGTARPSPAALLRTVVDTAGLPDAAYHLGDILTGGYGEAPDPAQAISLLKTAAEQGHARAWLDLGYIHLSDSFALRDPAAARRCFERCAALPGPYADLAHAELASLEGTSA